MAECNVCDGNGYVDCPKCGGEGESRYANPFTVLDVTNPTNYETEECSLCEGTGRKPCPHCDDN